MVDKDPLHTIDDASMQPEQHKDDEIIDTSSTTNVDLAHSSTGADVEDDDQEVPFEGGIAVTDPADLPEQTKKKRKSKKRKPASKRGIV